MNSGKIGIVTVLYGSEKVLPGFLLSLQNQTYRNFVLYVIDNKSPDNSVERFRQLIADCSFEAILVENDKNDGVARGNNIGIEKALENDCEYVLLSNNDVEFNSTTLELILKELILLGADMIAPKIYFYGTDKLWYAGGGFYKKNGHVKHFGYLEKDSIKYNERKEVKYAPTCFMLIRKNVFKEVGLMDEKYFVYWDDTDFVWRATKKEKKLWYTPLVTIQHKESSSTGSQSNFSIYYLHRNFIYFTLKNHPVLHTLFFLCVELVYHFSKKIIKLDFAQWKVASKGYMDGIKLYRSGK